MTNLKLAAWAFLVGGMSAFVAAAAYGAQVSVTEKGKVFSQSEISIKVGDTVLFVNDDDISHNVMSTNSENKFNLGLLPPGNSTPVTFNSPGSIVVLCAIHPTMKMTVNVSN